MSEQLIIQSHSRAYAVHFDDTLLSDRVRLLEGEPHFLIDANVARLYASSLRAIFHHPNATTIEAKEEMDPLGEILHDYDLAYFSNMTSAAVEAYLGGLPVVVMLDETELNLSPLRGQSGVRFVNTPEELAEALQTAGQGLATNPDRNEFFFLGPQLPRWKRLLSSASPA